MTELTVCMPVYNGEKYLSDSIGSILNQTYRDFRLLVYNDGSTDGTMDILRSFNDSRIRIMDNDSNRGEMFGRVGLINAVDTEYCVWCDDDDYFCRNDFFERALGMIKSGGYELVNFQNFDYLLKDGTRNTALNLTNVDFTYSGDKLFEKYFPVRNFASFCSKIFKTELLRKSLPSNADMERKRMFSDWFFAPLWYFHCKSYCHVASEEPFYTYRCDIGGFGSRYDELTAERMDSMCESYFRAFFSVHDRMTAVRELSPKEFSNLFDGIGFMELAWKVRDVRKEQGDAVADPLAEVCRSHFGADGIHFFNGKEGFEMPPYIQYFNTMLVEN